MRRRCSRQLKTEKLELQEAQRKNITVSPPEVDKQINGIINDNHLTMDQLDRHADAARRRRWRRCAPRSPSRSPGRRRCRTNIGDRINITRPGRRRRDWRASCEGANKPHYPGRRNLPAGRQSRAGRQGAEGRARTSTPSCSTARPFRTVARQFSQSPTAAAGGDIGWVIDGQLRARTERRAAASMAVGARLAADPLDRRLLHSRPARRARKPLGTKIVPDPATVTPQRPRLPAAGAPAAAAAGPRPPKEYVQKRHEASRARSAHHINGCAQAAEDGGADRTAIGLSRTWAR